MIELGKRQELKKLMTQLGLVIFGFGIILGILGTTIHGAWGAVTAEMVTPEVMFLHDGELGMKCGMYTDNTILAELFINLVEGRITPEQFTDRVIAVDPDYAVPAAEMIKDCGLNGGTHI